MLDHLSETQKQSLLAENAELRKLYHLHRKLDKKANDANIGALPMGTMALHELKREKLRTKEQLTNMLAAIDV